jgi:Transposase IS66 family
MPTTRRFRCWRRATVKQKPDGCGLTCAMIGGRELRLHRRFAYTPDRKGGHPKAHLKEFTGWLQADGYAGYDQLVIRKGGRCPTCRFKTSLCLTRLSWLV